MAFTWRVAVLFLAAISSSKAADVDIRANVRLIIFRNSISAPTKIYRVRRYGRWINWRCKWAFNGDKIRVASDALILARGRRMFSRQVERVVARATSICTECFNATRDTAERDFQVPRRITYRSVE